MVTVKGFFDEVLLRLHGGITVSFAVCSVQEVEVEVEV